MALDARSDLYKLLFPPVHTSFRMSVHSLKQWAGRALNTHLCFILKLSIFVYRERPATLRAINSTLGKASSDMSWFLVPASTGWKKNISIYSSVFLSTIYLYISIYLHRVNLFSPGVKPIRLLKIFIFWSLVEKEERGEWEDVIMA